MRLALCLLVLAAPASMMAQDIDSGPVKGKKVPEIKVYGISGPIQAEVGDYADLRKDKDTVYVIIPAKKFSRNMNQFIQGLDKAVDKEIKDGLVVAVWLTDDQEKTKKFLPKLAQMYQTAAVGYFPGDKTGPKDWFINDQAEITVILARKGMVVGRLGYASINDTVVKNVMKAFTKAVQEK